MKAIILVLVLFSSLIGFAQNSRQQINDQVWKPFIQSQINIDENLFMNIHSRDLIRTERSNKKVYGYDSYATLIGDGFKRAAKAKAKGDKIEFAVEVRFLERVASVAQAYEVGYYKSHLKLPDGKEYIYYSEFHVTLRKENDQWKILTDSSLPLPDLTEQKFQSAQSLEI